MEIQPTRIGSTGIVTMIKGDASGVSVEYAVSTTKMGDTSLFQTMVLATPGSNPCYRIERATMSEALAEHIDTVNMVIQKPRALWEGTKSYQDDLMNECLASRQLPDLNNQRVNWTTSKNIDTLRAAGLNAAQHFPRYVPIISGLFWIGVSFGIAWWTRREGGKILKFLCALIFAFGFNELVIGIFATQDRINENDWLGATELWQVLRTGKIEARQKNNQPIHRGVK